MKALIRADLREKKRASELKMVLPIREGQRNDRVAGLPAFLRIAPGRELLCDKSKEQSGCTQAVLGSSGLEYRVGVRSADCAERPLKQTILSGTVAVHPVQSAGNRQDVGLVGSHTTLSALSICALYKSRWEVEQFFRWIKQNHRITSLYGTSENADTSG